MLPPSHAHLALDIFLLLSWPYFFFLDKYLLPVMECIIASALISLARKLYPGTVKGK